MFTILDGRKDFFQWDLNQKLIVAEKVDRVHFEIGGKIEATEVKEEDGIFVAEVPNVILQIAGKLLVYAYIIGEGEEESITKIKECFGIKGRAKPPDYVYTETEVLSYEAIRKELADIEKRLKNVEENGGGGGTGTPGGYYVPNISEDGVLSWEPSNEEMPEVPKANIIGPPGYTPQKGIDYFDGEPGKPGEPGYTPQKGVDYFDGEPGKPGEPGKTPNIQIGTVETVGSQEKAAATITGSAENPILNFKLPQGEKGNQGESGKGLVILGYYSTLLQLETSVANPSVGDIYGVGFAAPYNLYAWDGKQWVDNGQLQGAKGEKGDPFRYEDFTPEQLKSLKGSDANVTSENIKNALGYVPANPSAIPTKTSQLQNDEGFVDEERLKQYAQPKDDYALKRELPKNTSDLNNDSGFITAGDIPAPPEIPVKSVFGRTGNVTAQKGDYTAEMVGADKEGKAVEEVGKHNVDDEAHNDIRVKLSELQAAIEAFLNIDDTEFDQLSELIEKIRENAGSITELTNGKVNVSDIVNNLTTNASNKPLSAAQGATLKGLVNNLETVANNATTTANNASNKVDDLKERMDSGEFKGDKGDPGYSPAVFVSEIDGGHKVIIHHTNGSDEFNVMDGAAGTNGKNGTSVTITNITGSTASGGTNTVTFSDGKKVNIKNGINGTNGKDGTSVTVSNVSESTASGGTNTVTFSDGKKVNIKNGINGKDGLDGASGASGYTPIKGIDYYTEADKAEIEAYIATELAKRGQLKPAYPEGETVDECLKWLAENGDQSKMYVLPDGFIYAWKLTKTEVEGDSYTNLLQSATDTDRKTIYGGDYNGDGVNDGYIKGKRLSSSGSVSASESNTACCASGFISAKVGDIVRIKNLEPITKVSCYIISYNSSNTKVAYKTFQIMSSTTGYFGGDWLTADATNKLITFELTSANFGTGFDAVRFSGLISDNTIVTVNEEIKESGTTVIEEYKWANTNLAFVPADYGDMVADHERRIVRNTEEIAALKETVESNGSSVLTEAEKLEKIKTWDKPVFDYAEVTLIADENTKPALTTSDRTISAIYAKYRALMAAHPEFITETNMGKSTGSSTFTAVDMLRFDFKEPDGLTQPDLGESALHETKPKLIFMSGVHTEWVGVWGLYYALEEITTNPAFDDIRRNCHIIVVPCANPFCLTSQTAIEGWRMSHVNANGVAIHNNFGVDHSTSGNVGEYNYGGAEPYSELETQYIDKIMADNPDAVAFISCHNNDYSTYYGSHVIWASSATYHMCNLTFRLVDKMSKAWINKYGQTLKNSIDEYKINMSADDYRLGRATMSSSKGTEQKNALKYGIQGVNVEISRMMKIFSGNTDGTSEVMTHGAEVYANLIRTILMAYENNDKKAYYE